MQRSKTALKDFLYFSVDQKPGYTLDNNIIVSFHKWFSVENYFPNEDKESTLVCIVQTFFIAVSNP